MKSALEHIVFLTPGFPESETDSTTIPALQDYILAFSKVSGLTQITIITFQFPFKKEHYYWHGIKVIPLNGRNKKWNKISIWYKAIENLKKLNEENNITVLHSFWIGECSFVGQWFAQNRSIRHIVTAMGQDVFGNKFARFLNPKTSKIVTLSQPHHDLLQQNYGQDSTVIPWSVEPTAFPELKESSIDVLGVGSLTPIKDYQAFISVIKMVASKIPDLKVEIIGEGGEYQNLQQKIVENQLTSIITLTGKLSRSEVYRKMSAAKIILHTSHYESFGYVFAEALYSGMKIVSYPVGFSRNIAQWKTALTESEMAQEVLKFLKDNDPKSRISLTKKEETLNAYLQLYHE